MSSEEKLHKVVNADPLLRDIRGGRAIAVAAAPAENAPQLERRPRLAQQLEAGPNFVHCDVAVAVQIEHTEGSLEVIPSFYRVIR